MANEESNKGRSNFAEALQNLSRYGLSGNLRMNYSRCDYCRKSNEQDPDLYVGTAKIVIAFTTPTIDKQLNLKAHICASCVKSLSDDVNHHIESIAKKADEREVLKGKNK